MKHLLLDLAIGLGSLCLMATCIILGALCHIASGEPDVNGDPERDSNQHQNLWSSNDF